MDPLTIVAILSALIKLGSEVPALVQAGETAIGLLRSGAAPTDAEQATIDAGLDAADAALQAS